MQPLGVRLYYAGGTFSMKLILASASARRAEILHDAGLSFSVLSSAVDETPMAGETPGGVVQRVVDDPTGYWWCRGPWAPPIFSPKPPAACRWRPMFKPRRPR